jgi:hypothetical protein
MPDATQDAPLLKVPPASEGNRGEGFRVLVSVSTGQGSVPLAEQGEPNGGGLGTLMSLSA